MGKRKVSQAGRKTFFLQANNKYMVCFFDDACYQYFLVRLLNCLQPFQADLHAYCLIQKSVYLLLSSGSLANVHGLWQSVSSRYNRYFKERFDRNIRILEPAQKHTRIVTSQEVLELQKLIERMPLQAGIADAPGAHPWTSYTSNAFGTRIRGLKPHPQFTQFKQLHADSLPHYRDFIRSPIQSKEIAERFLPMDADPMPAAADQSTQSHGALHLSP